MYRAKSQVGIFASAAIILSACTTAITSRQIDLNSKVVGPAYHLPATAFEVQIKYQIHHCGSSVDTSIAIMNGSITPKMVPDRSPEATYIVDQTKLSKWTKTVELAKLELANGVLKTASYKASDQTRAIIAGAARQAMRFGLGSGFGGGVIALSDTSICNPETRKALTLKRQIDRAIEDLQVQWVALTKKMAANPDNDTKAKRALVAEALVDATERLATLKSDKLIVTASATVTPKAGQLSDIPVDMSPAVFLKWFRQDLGGGDDDALRKRLEGLVKKSKLRMGFVDSNGEPVKPTPQTSVKAGLAYRIPARVRLKVTHEQTSLTIIDQEVEVLQLGTVAAIVMDNGPFQENTENIVFDANGHLQSFQYVESKARALELANTADDVTTSLANREGVELDHLKSIAEKKAALATARKNQLEAESALRAAVVASEGK